MVGVDLSVALQLTVSGDWAWWAAASDLCVACAIDEACASEWSVGSSAAPLSQETPHVGQTRVAVVVVLVKICSYCVMS